MKRVWILLVSLAVGVPLFLFALNAALYDGIDSLRPEDTAYSPGYDEGRFRALEPPMSTSVLLQQLGEPLYRSVHEDGSASWVYSRSPSDTHYRERIFHIKGDIAIEKTHQFYVD